jgi:uncharacterized membrane protein
LWLVFIATHIGLATQSVRARLVARLGDWGFNLMYSGIAGVCFAAVVCYYAAHRVGGLPGLALGHVVLVRGVLMGVIVLGVVIATASFASYGRSPYAVLSGRAVRGPYGLERITRHPFFAGVTLIALAHVLLAQWLIGTVFGLGLAALATVGSYHQDRKLLARKGPPYAEYLRVTSAVPFAAIAAGRQQLVWRELPVTALGLGVAVAVALRLVHGLLFASGGFWFVAVVLGSVALLTLQAWQAAGRPGGDRVLGYLLVATGIGHTVVGLILFRRPLIDMLSDGVVGTVAADQLDRLAAFWFMLFGPVCFALGQIVNRAIERGDWRTVSIVGWYLLAIGIAGAAVMPVSGFWLVIAIAPLILRTARRETRQQIPGAAIRSV